MKKIRAYANYGVLAHEKQIIFTVGNPHGYAGVSDEIEIQLPEGWEAEENRFGGTLITSPDGDTSLARNVISSHGDNPVLDWYDGEQGHRITLEWAKINA